jgi:hypothetical protein
VSPAVKKRTNRTPKKRPSKVDQREMQALAKDVDAAKFVLDLLGRSDIDVTESVVSGEVVRTIEGASTVTLTVRDSERALISDTTGRGAVNARSALTDSEGELRTVDVQLDGLWFRLTKLSKSGNDLTLTLEDRAVARLRSKKGPRKARSRAKVTRAQYILSLVRSLKGGRIPVKIHALRKKQPIKGRSRKDRKDKRDEDRRAGFDEGEKVEGVNAKQLRRIETCMEEVESISGVTERVLLAMLVAGFGETEWGENLGSRGTTFQTTQLRESQLASQARHFMIGGKGFLEGGAIKYARDNPKASIGQIASKVEISDAGASHYDKHRGRARRVLKAWGGAGGSSTSFKRYEYKVNKGETYWDAIQRMAGEVHWRAFMSGKTFRYISEEELFRSRARYRINEDDPSIQDISWDWDYRKKVAKLSVACRLGAWEAPPGTVIVVEEQGPASGRWLVETVTRDLFSPAATITLKKPMGELPEPRPEEAGGDDSSSTDLYDICKRFSGPYKYGGGHGPQLSSIDFSDGLDCSSSTSKALKEAGLFSASVSWVSGQFASSYGKAGKGKEFTVWANSGHVYIEFHGEHDGWRFDTSARSDDKPDERGPRLRKGRRSSAGFTARHRGEG